MNPLADMETHALRRKLPRTLSINEMNKLLTCIRQAIPALSGIPNEETFLTVRDRALLETLYSAALPVSELCDMNWQDIDWNKREVTVTGKGNKRTRERSGELVALDSLKVKARWVRGPIERCEKVIEETNLTEETRCYIPGKTGFYLDYFRCDDKLQVMEINL